jgi:hypothetical protein
MVPCRVQKISLRVGSHIQHFNVIDIKSLCQSYPEFWGADSLAMTSRAPAGPRETRPVTEDKGALLALGRFANNLSRCVAGEGTSDVCEMVFYLTFRNRVKSGKVVGRIHTGGEGEDDLLS